MNLVNFAFAEAKGIVIKASGKPVKNTTDLLEGFLRSHGATVYARIDQQSEAKKGGIKISPLEYLLFGNPAKGAPLLAANPLIGLDLPLKIICWQDLDGKTLIAFNEYGFILSRYGLERDEASPLNLANLVDQVLKQTFQN